MTWKEAWKRGAQSLQKAGVEEYDLDAWYLLEHVTGITKASYYMEPEHPMHDQEEREYLELIRKRSTRIPLQHLTGVQEFMGLEFLVNEHVLIPRQDTEVLVETALDVCKQEQMGEIRLLDMCTGSGCILLSLLHELKPRTVTGVGVDLSKEALCVAEKNAEKLKIDAEFLESDLFENVKGTYDVIVSNPPYIRTSVIVWVTCWLGNLAGSVLVAGMYSLTGLCTGSVQAIMADTTAMKMSVEPLPLFMRAILCNILVCLAVWCGIKMKTETGKLIMTFWCLITFFTAGFEHSVANMSLMMIGLLNPAQYDISIGGYAYNLAVVTIGNMVGGILFLAVPYFLIGKEKAAKN